MGKDSQNSVLNIDVNGFEFYNNLQDEIESDLARLQKNVKILSELRLTAAEMEVESAILYHAELWYDIEDLKKNAEKNMEIGGSNEQNTSTEVTIPMDISQSV